MSDFVIGRRELYILPTRIGWYYALILIALFAIAVKFDNQPAFMMLFVLASIGMVAMLYTHNNVIGLSLNSKPSRSVFVGENAIFPVSVDNKSRSQRRAVWLVCDGYHQLINLGAQEQQEAALKLPTIKRGYLNCASVIITSRFPIGIFFCWTKRFDPEHRCLVYPQPLKLYPFPEQGEASSAKSLSHRSISNAEDYSGMKPYQPGDRLRDVHWPSLAKTQKLITIEHQDRTGDSVSLSWFSLPPNMGVEDKLSQLCQWVIEADAADLRYQLELPNHTEQFASGDAHYHKCLSTLALWESHEAA